MLCIWLISFQQILVFSSAVLVAVLPSMINCATLHHFQKWLPTHSNSTNVIALSKKGRTTSMSWAVSQYVRQWTCQSEPSWRDLGSGHYPQFIQEYSCSNGPCWYGHFQCMPQYYTVRVLSNTWMDADDSVLSIPGLNNWKLVDVRAVVGCVCMVHWSFTLLSNWTHILFNHQTRYGAFFWQITNCLIYFSFT